MKDKLTFFNSRTFFSGIGISLIFSISKTSFWISEIIGIILGTIILMLVKETNDSKVIKGIIGFLLAILSLSILVNMGHTLYLNETPIFILALVPVIATFILGKSNDYAFKKVVYIFFIYSIVLFFLKILGLYSYINLENLRPFFTVDFKDIIWASIIYMLISITPVLALDDITDKKRLISTYLISSLTTLVVSFLAISVLGVKEVTLYRNPEFIVLKQIKFLDFVNNVDNFFNFAILLDLLFTASVGMKKIQVENKIIKSALYIMLFLAVLVICYTNSPLLWLYTNLPFVFIFLLIILLIPKKKKYKTS